MLTMQDHWIQSALIGGSNEDTNKRKWYLFTADQFLISSKKILLRRNLIDCS